MPTVDVYECGASANTVGAIKHLRLFKGLGLAEAKAPFDGLKFHSRPFTVEFADGSRAQQFMDAMTDCDIFCRFAVTRGT